MILFYMVIRDLMCVKDFNRLLTKNVDYEATALPSELSTPYVEKLNRLTTTIRTQE